MNETGLDKTGGDGTGTGRDKDGTGTGRKRNIKEPNRTRIKWNAMEWNYNFK